MKAGVALIAILMWSMLPAEGFTVIMKNGKTMEGFFLSEDPAAIRFRDIYGVEYSLRKDLLNIPAMLDANPEIRPPAQPARPEARNPSTTIVLGRKPTLAEIARDNRKNRTGTAPVLRATRPALPSWPKELPALETWIARTEKDLQRLAGRCRAAGGDPNAKRSYQTSTYVVQGKSVVVSGYWADPAEIEKARRICDEAVVTEKALTRARQDLAFLQSIASSAPASDGGR